MSFSISMGTLGIYIFSPERPAGQQWYCGSKLPTAAGAKKERWGSFDQVTEWSEGEEQQVEAVREMVSKKDEATYTMVAVH